MSGQHLRVFAVTGTGMPFPRLLGGLRAVAADPGVDLFVQRGAAGAGFADLPGEDFISREAFAERLAWADVVVSHGGAGTLFEACRAGHAPIVVPRRLRWREHVNDHQVELAHELARAGRATVCDDADALAGVVRAARRRALADVARDERLVRAVREALLGAPVDADRARRRPGLGSIVRGLARRASARAARG